MGRRSRKRPVSAPTTANAPQPPAEPPARDARRSRSAERDADARASLTPLEPGERPPALKIAAAASLVFAVANAALFAAGVEVEGDPSATGVVLFGLIMVVAAWGIWAQRYWAVLGFQALLVWSLVRVLGRMKVPRLGE